MSVITVKTLVPLLMSVSRVCTTELYMLLLYIMTFLNPPLPSRFFVLNFQQKTRPFVLMKLCSQNNKECTWRSIHILGSASLFGRPTLGATEYTLSRTLTIRLKSWVDKTYKTPCLN